MAKAKQKKPSEFNEDMTKCVFLHGRPNKDKADALIRIQQEYTNEVNRFIRLVDGESGLFLSLVKHDRYAPEMRAFERSRRDKEMNSSYSQSAFDMAVDHLYNRVTDIRHELYGILDNVFVRSKVLFAMAITDRPREEMASFLKGMSEKAKKGRAFYQELLQGLPEGKEFADAVAETCAFYAYLKDGYKLPEVRHARVRLVSKAHSLSGSGDAGQVGPSSGVKAPYVIEIADPARKNKRIQVPLDASGDAIRRLKQYGPNATVDFTMLGDGRTLRVAVSFSKKLREPETARYIGVDVGIKDMLHTSDGHAFGTFHECEKFYKETVEPSFAGLSGLRNKKRSIHVFLRRHKGTLPPGMVKKLRDKMDLLDAMVRKAKTPARKNNRYHGMQDHAVREAVDAYVGSLGGDKGTCTVIELLDVKEFNKASKKQNQYLSNFARGKLALKLMDALNWHGYTYLQVDSAYTSQECPVCHHVSRENRNNKVFRCTCCGHTDDADHVGAVNILSRAEDTEIASAASRYAYNTVLRHKAIKGILEGRHNVWADRKRLLKEAV